VGVLPEPINPLVEFEHPEQVFLARVKSPKSEVSPNVDIVKYCIIFRLDKGAVPVPPHQTPLVEEENDAVLLLDVIASPKSTVSPREEIVTYYNMMECQIHLKIYP
jgi:hypothetical protein